MSDKDSGLERLAEDISAPVRYRHLRRMEKEEVVMRNIQDLLDKIGLGVFVVCGIILMIALTSAFLFFLAETIIEVANNGINGV